MSKRLLNAHRPADATVSGVVLERYEDHWKGADCADVIDAAGVRLIVAANATEARAVFSYLGELPAAIMSALITEAMANGPVEL